jgi:hypothetical protein
VSARARNERFSERHGGRGIGGRKKRANSERRGGQDVGKRKKRAMQLAERRARERNELFSERHGVVGTTSTRGRNIRFSEQRGGYETETSNSASPFKRQAFYKQPCRDLSAPVATCFPFTCDIHGTYCKAKKISDLPRGTAGKILTIARNVRFS